MPKFVEIPGILEEDLVLPIRAADGEVREYRIKPASAADYITMQALNAMVEGKIAPTGSDLARLSAVDTVEASWMLILGHDTAKAMQDDGISASDLRRASQTAYMWHVTGGDEAAAAKVWDPKAPAVPTTGSPTSSGTRSGVTGAAGGTRKKPASTRRTSTRQATKSGLPRSRTTPGPTSGDASI